MNVFLIGGAGVFINQIMIKLRKEGHRVYVLSGTRYKQENYEKAFEIYNFTYNSDCMNEIFESVKPDVTVFMGAFDSNFTWLDERRDSVRFNASLTNLLSAYSMGDYGRFIYLSSSEVYSGDFAQDITEDQVKNAGSYRGMAFGQGEDLCRSYYESRGLDVVTLRLDHMYLVPSRRSEVDGVCANMCLSALLDGRITANVNHRFAMIYMTDAVEYIYRMMDALTHEYPLYNISSSEEITELELAQYICTTDGMENVIIEEQNDWNAREVLSNKRFDEEFGIRIFHHASEVAPKIMSYMMQHKRIFRYLEDEKESFGERLRKRLGWFVRLIVPFLENIVCFLLFYMLNNWAGQSEYFANLDIFLLYVLLFAIIHGQQQAIFSGVLAVVGYIFQQMHQSTGFEVLMDYNTYIWIAQLFILGLAVGYLKDQMRMIKSEGDEEQEFLQYRLRDMTDINQSNVRVKDVLETEIVNHNDSIGKIYAITSQLDRYLPEEVLFYAAEVISRLMNSRDVAIYSVSNHDFARLASSTSPKARCYGHSIRYREMEDLSRALEEQKIYINRTMNESYPHMASAIYEEDQMKLIVMVWGIPWEQMTLGQANVLTVISYLIQNAVLHADRYMAALEDKRYVNGENVMETESFTTLVRSFRTAMNKQLTECALLHIKTTEGDYNNAGNILTKKLRQSDYLGTLEDGKLYALLANTSQSAAQIVIDRFAECGYEAELVEEIVA